jgi:hypothetical protein
MELVVDLSTGGVVLHRPDDLERLMVRAMAPDDGVAGPGDGALGAVAAALSVHHVGTVDPSGDALIPPSTLRSLAAEAAADQGGALDPGWDDRFDTMVAYADSKGWIADDGSVRVHIEWGD